MERINWIINYPLYRSSYERLELLEKNRIFCCHQLPHLLDVARIAYIQNLEQNLGLDKALIYATAILHDIGKAKQYEEQIPHEIASADIAMEILASMPEGLCFTTDEQEQILSAIRSHRKPDETATVLGKLLYKSDKASRNCFCCLASKECNWDNNKKNMEITD